jgi:hypothetical protein
MILWTEEEKQFLIDNYDILGAKAIAKHIGKTFSAVCTRAEKFGLKHQRPIWTDEEIESLKKNYLILGAKKLATVLNKSIDSIKNKAEKLNITFTGKTVKCKDPLCNEIINLRIVSNGYCKKHTEKHRKEGEFSNQVCSCGECTNKAMYNNTNTPMCFKCWNKKHYYRERAGVLAKINRPNTLKLNKKRNLKRLNEVFTILGNECFICAEKDKIILQLHHRRSNPIFRAGRRKGGQRTNEITSMYNGNMYKMKNLLLLCANCHIKQNLEDGTSGGGERMYRVSRGIFEKRHDKHLYYALSIYGSRCQKCGCSDIVVLQWHHKIKYFTGKKEYFNHLLARILFANKPLDDVTLLCANCHIKQNLIDKTVLVPPNGVSIEEQHISCHLS